MKVDMPRGFAKVDLPRGFAKVNMPGGLQTLISHGSLLSWFWQVTRRKLTRQGSLQIDMPRRLQTLICHGELQLCFWEVTLQKLTPQGSLQKLICQRGFAFVYCWKSMIPRGVEIFKVAFSRGFQKSISQGGFKRWFPKGGLQMSISQAAVCKHEKRVFSH